MLIAFVSACQNPYDKFYTSDVPSESERWLLPHLGEPRYFSASASDMQPSVQMLLRQGYIVIGYASFEANARDYDSALHAQAKKVQADIVLLSSSYAGTRTGVMPLTVYKPGQTYTTYSTGQVNANAFGSGGYAQGTANYSGTATTTASGSIETNYVPYNIQRNQYGAIFLRKYHYLIGTRTSPLSDELRIALQQNTGVVVNIVVEGTPAFVANILPGDILLTLDGEVIESQAMLNRRSLEKAGQVVKFGILRNGRARTVEVQLNPAALGP